MHSHPFTRGTAVDIKSCDLSRDPPCTDIIQYYTMRLSIDHAFYLSVTMPTHSIRVYMVLGQ